MAHGVRMLLPFAERIAVRAMVLSAFAGASMVVLFALLGSGVGSGAGLRWLVVATAAVSILFVSSLIAFLSLFARFDQGRRTNGASAT